MQINLTRRVLDEMTDDDLSVLNRTVSNVRGQESLPVDLLPMAEADVDAFRAVLVRLQNDGKRGMGVLIRDIDNWRDAVRNGTSGSLRPRRLRNFSNLLSEYIRKVDGHRVYQKAEGSDEWLPYYVNYVQYEPERRTHDRYQPASVYMQLLYWLLGRLHTTAVWFHRSDVDGCTVAEALGKQGLLVETPELREEYLRQNGRFNELHNRIGVQLLASGHGMGIDTRQRARIAMTHDGAPAKVVIDVVHEPGEHVEEQRRSPLRTDFWRSVVPSAPQEEDSDALVLNESLLDGDDTEDIEASPEIPVHPYVPIYHLDRHQRYRINVGLLEDYQYNRNLEEQLVLPDFQKRLLDVLVSQGRIDFRDIVEGKGSGACILLSGPPGVGKTMSAEVFAEATGRPLLSVQADQLGVSPEGIEKKLAEVLRRCSRWNAVLLLDEADVYINARNANIVHNAIVAAFLRVLERHDTTIFMTCNYLDAVDDAVASRCLARIKFEKPNVDDQRQIWHIMNDLNDTGLSDEEIDAIVAEHNDLTGRDIKQLLKLGTLWASSYERPVSPEAITRIKEFRPNQ